MATKESIDEQIRKAKERAESFHKSLQMARATEKEFMENFEREKQTLENERRSLDKEKQRWAETSNLIQSMKQDLSISGGSLKSMISSVGSSVEKGSTNDENEGINESNKGYANLQEEVDLLREEVKNLRVFKIDAEGKLKFRLEQVVQIEAEKEKIARQNSELIASNAALEKKLSEMHNELKNALQELQELKSMPSQSKVKVIPPEYLDRDISSFTRSRLNLQRQGDGRYDNVINVGDDVGRDCNQHLLTTSIDSNASLEDAVKAELEETRRSVKELARASMTHEILQRHLDNDVQIDQSDDDSEEPIFSTYDKKSANDNNAIMNKSLSEGNDAGDGNTVTGSILSFNVPPLDSDSDDIPLMSSVTNLRPGNLESNKDKSAVCEDKNLTSELGGIDTHLTLEKVTASREEYSSSRRPQSALGSSKRSSSLTRTIKNTNSVNKLISRSQSAASPARGKTRLTSGSKGNTQELSTLSSANRDAASNVISRRAGVASAVAKGTVRNSAGAPSSANRSASARLSSSSPTTSSMATITRSRSPIVVKRSPSMTRRSKHKDNQELLKSSSDFVAIPGIAFREKVDSVNKKKLDIRDSQGSIQSNRSKRSSLSNKSNKSASFDLSADNETSIRNDVRKAVAEIRSGRNVSTLSSAALSTGRKKKPVSSYATNTYTRSVVSSGYGNNNPPIKKADPSTKKTKDDVTVNNKVVGKRRVATPVTTQNQGAKGNDVKKGNGNTTMVKSKASFR